MSSEQLSTDVTNSADADQATSSAAAPKPRIRSGAIAWGLIVCAAAIAVLATIASPSARDGFVTWLIGLNPGGVALVAVLAVGVFILLLAGLALIRRAQRR